MNGQAEVVIQSADAYQKLLQDHELLESLRSVDRGLEEAKRGEGRPMLEPACSKSFKSVGRSRRTCSLHLAPEAASRAKRLRVAEFTEVSYKSRFQRKRHVERS